MHPTGKVTIKWSPKFAYAIGLIATDGNLSKDGRHIIFTSKDLQLARLFHSYFGLQVSIGKKSRGYSFKKKYFNIQFGDVIFYRFLLSIGLTPNKSKTLKELKIPKKYFLDFFRGCLDGDGTIGTYFHPESKHLQLRVRLYSASRLFVNWIRKELLQIGVQGYVTCSRGLWSLVYAIKASTKLLNLVYYAGHPKSLGRKYKLAKKYADVV